MDPLNPFEPFVPNMLPLVDAEICSDNGNIELTEHGRGQVLIKDPDTGLCTACPEATCNVWVPDPTGNYMQHCTGVYATPPPGAQPRSLDRKRAVLPG